MIHTFIPYFIENKYISKSRKHRCFCDLKKKLPNLIDFCSTFSTNNKNSVIFLIPMRKTYFNQAIFLVKTTFFAELWSFCQFWKREHFRRTFQRAIGQYYVIRYFKNYPFAKKFKKKYLLTHITIPIELPNAPYIFIFD